MVLVDFPVKELESLKEGLQVIKILKVEGLTHGEGSRALLSDSTRTNDSKYSFLRGMEPFFADDDTSLFDSEDDDSFQESFTPSCIPELARALHGSECLTSLIVQKCKISAASANILFVEGLSSIVSLTKLKLHECEIGDDEIEALVENWLPNSTIECLSLQNNTIGPNGVQTLLRATSNHPNLRKLDISNNSSIGYEGLQIIGDELPNQEYLVHVELSGCVSCDDISRGVRLILERTQNTVSHQGLAGLSLLAGIKRNFHIRHLNVRMNDFSKDVENNIHFYANANMGRYLMTADPQDIAPSVWSYILAKSARQEQIRLGASVIYFYLLEQPTLVQRISYSSR